jgi:D-glycero-D-manno-heptose 1,7-bisphosphate phosphatase
MTLLDNRDHRHGQVIEAVMCDRDGTLIEDIPYNGDPTLVTALDGVVDGLALLRNRGIPLAMVTNQSGVARGLIERDDVDAVNRAVVDLVGPLDVVAVCVHDDRNACDCRKPKPGLILQAARALGIDPAGCVVVGNSSVDVEAAERAGARAILIAPSADPDAGLEGRSASVVPSFGKAVELIMGAL